MSRTQYGGVLFGLAVIFFGVVSVNLRMNADRAADQRATAKKQAALILQVAVDRVDVGRRNCERGKLDRRDNARGWKAAEKARRVAASKEQGIEHETDLRTARLYHRIHRSLSRRTTVDCKDRFPMPIPPPGVKLPPPTPAA